MQNYHLTPEQAFEMACDLDLAGLDITVWENGYVEFETKKALQSFANAVLDRVLGGPVAEVEVRKNRILTDTLMQATTPISDGRRKLYAPKEQS